MAFTNEQLADYYKSTVGAGSMTEAQFVDLAKQHNVGNDQLLATQGMLLSGYGSTPTPAPAATPSPAYSPAPTFSAPTDYGSSMGGGYGTAPSYGADARSASTPAPAPAPASQMTTAPAVKYSHPTNQQMPSFVTGNQAQMSRWAGMDAGTVNNIRGMIDGYVGGTVDAAAVGRAATAANLSGAQLAQLVNDRLGTDFTAEQAVAFARTSSPGTQFGPNAQYTAGYGGWQPSGSMYAGDDPMPVAYIQRLPEINKSTENAVNYALSQAIETQRANGYDPEKSNSVQTLRGYYSDDPQLRSNAIRAAVYYVKQANPGAYETTDYGHHAIVGFDQTVAAPTFQTAFDKDWERPTLYDMINSSMGWDAANNNYADPKSRDANLNRRLTDAEIRAFQEGKLTPELASVVQRYRGDNPTGGGSFGGGAGSAGAGAGGGGGAGAGGGAGGGGPMGIPTTGINLSQLQGSTGWNVAPNQTVQSQLEQVIAADSPLMQQARTRALQQANQRGLLNSSIAVTAGQSAVLDAATPIAQQDASTYGDAARFNADASNTFGRENNAFVRDAFMADFNLGANEWAAQQDFARQYQMLDRQQQFALERDAVQNGYQTARDRYMNEWSVSAANKENALRLQLANMDNPEKRLQTQVEANRQEQALTTLNNARSNYASQMITIATSGLSGDAKDKAIGDLTVSTNAIIQGTAQRLGWSPDSWLIKIDTTKPADKPAADAGTTNPVFEGGGA